MFDLVDPYNCQEEFNSIEPFAVIAPFNMFNGKHINYPLKVITTPDAVPKFNPIHCEIRTLKNLHAKLVLGRKGALLGSWNFTLANYKSDISPPTWVELIIKVPAGTEEFNKLEKFFDYLWELAKPIEANQLSAKAIIPDKLR